LKKNNAIAIRDSLRNEVSKQARIGDENKEKREQKVKKSNDKIILLFFYYSMNIYDTTVQEFQIIFVSACTRHRLFHPHDPSFGMLLSII
jgi:hypothetical protein